MSIIGVCGCLMYFYSFFSLEFVCKLSPITKYHLKIFYETNRLIFPDLFVIEVYDSLNYFSCKICHQNVLFHLNKIS